MPAPISVVIPTLNAARDLPGALAALVEGLEVGLVRELVISDGGSADATSEIADAAGARVVVGSCGRGAQIASGVTSAHGEWVLILHADSRLAPGWTSAVSAHLGDPSRAAYFRLAFRAEGLAPGIVAGWANMRARLFGLPYGDQGLLVSKRLLEAVGGMPNLPLMEDVALARALTGRLTMLPAEITTSAERYQREGWVPRGGRNLWLLIRYVLGADPEVLARSYERRRQEGD